MGQEKERKENDSNAPIGFVVVGLCMFMGDGREPFAKQNRTLSLIQITKK